MKSKINPVEFSNVIFLEKFLPYIIKVEAGAEKSYVHLLQYEDEDVHLACESQLKSGFSQLHGFRTFLITF